MSTPETEGCCAELSDPYADSQFKNKQANNYSVLWLVSLIGWFLEVCLTQGAIYHPEMKALFKATDFKV